MLTVTVVNAHRRRRVRRVQIAGYVKRVLRSMHVRNAQISVVLIGSRYCRKINREYLHHDYITDVISFLLDEAPVLEAEIYINLDRAVTQSKEYSVSLAREIARLAIHGTLHLVGFDDMTNVKRNRMVSEENRHLSFWFH